MLCKLRDKTNFPKSADIFLDYWTRLLALCLDACRVLMHVFKGLITDEGYCCRKRLLAFDDSVFMRVNETELFGVTSITVSFLQANDRQLPPSGICFFRCYVFETLYSRCLTGSRSSLSFATMRCCSDMGGRGNRQFFKSEVPKRCCPAVPLKFSTPYVINH